MGLTEDPISSDGKAMDREYHQPIKSVQKANARNRFILTEHGEDNRNDLL